MSLEHSDIQSLKAAILAEAQQDAAEILADARSRAQSIQRQAHEQENAQQEAILDQGRQKAEALCSQALISTQLEAQTLQLKRREEILAKVFAEARRQLAAAPQWPDYAQIVRRLVQEAAQNLGDSEGLVILADPATQAVIDAEMISSLEQELGIQIEAGDLLEQGIGVVLQTVDGHRRYDNTLGVRLGRMQGFLRKSVYQIVIGEAP